MNIQLRVISQHEARITWERPSLDESEIYGYAIEWRLNRLRQEPILLKDRQEYTFSDLPPGHLLSAAVRIIPNRHLYEEGGYVGPISDDVEVVLPGKNQNFSLTSDLGQINRGSKEVRLFRHDFSTGHITPDSIQLIWSSNALLAKGIKNLTIAIAPSETPDKRSYHIIGAGSGNAIIGRLNALTSYRVIVRESGNDTTTVDLGHITTWPTGNIHFITSLHIFHTAPLLNMPRGRAQSDTEIIIEWLIRSPRKGILRPSYAECKDEHSNRVNRVFAANNETKSLIIRDLEHNRVYNCTLTASTYCAYGQDPKECRISAKLPPIRTQKHCEFKSSLLITKHV